MTAPRPQRGDRGGGSPRGARPPGAGWRGIRLIETKLPTWFGFSLLEVVLALLLLGLALVPMFSLFSQGSTGTIQTRHEIEAYSLASDLLHLARGLAFDDPLLAAGTRAVSTLPPLGAGAPSIEYQRSLTVTEGQPAGGAVPYRYKILVARVAWQSGGVARAIRMSSLIFAVKP